MNINISNSENKSVNLITRITLILFGVFLTSVIFGLTIHAFSTKGLVLGIIISLACIGYGFYYCKKKSYRRIISWGMLGTLVSGTVIFLVVISLVSSIA